MQGKEEKGPLRRVMASPVIKYVLVGILFVAAENVNAMWKFMGVCGQRQILSGGERLRVTG
jgi:hypothetical protein